MNLVRLPTKSLVWIVPITTTEVFNEREARTRGQTKALLVLFGPILKLLYYYLDFIY